VSSDRRQLRARFVSPAVPEPLRSGFHYPADDGGFFSRLLAAPASFWLRAESRRRMAAMMPAGLLALVGEGEFFATSLFSGERSIGILYADRADRPEAPALDPETFRRFRRIGAAASAILGHAAAGRHRAA
jgi:hypothetical protein